jgi:alkanesulfonate monooxygenase SsuD/methylene tetrahydromethanopterin reductase-like flavin-dependent oxidoreductase (luciferase family)
MLSRTQPRPVDALGATLADIQNPIVDAYLAALPPGRAPRIVGSRSVFVADTRQEALRLADIGLRRSAARFAASGQAGLADRAGPHASLEQLIAAYDVHVGAPDDVIASLRADSTLARVSDLVCQVHSVDPPHEAILRSIELTATVVAPALGWVRDAAADLSPPPLLKAA